MAPQKLYLKERVAFLKKAIQSERQKLEQASLRCTLLGNLAEQSKSKSKTAKEK